MPTGGIRTRTSGIMVPAFVAPAGGAPSSPSLTNLWGWWYANEGSYTETTGTPTTLITIDGTSIGSQLDQSGNARHIYQPAAGQQPIYKTGILNSLAVARYTNAATSNLQTDITGGAPSGDSFSIFAVAQQTATNNFASIVTNTDGGLSPRYLVMDNGANQVKIFNGGFNTPKNFSVNNYHLVSTSIDNTGSFPVVFQIDNGTATTENVTGSGNLGTAVVIGLFNSVAWTGDIVEVLLYTSILSFTTGDGLRARQYLNGKYNLGLGI